MAKYVNFTGFTSNLTPGNIATLAVWDYNAPLDVLLATETVQAPSAGYNLGNHLTISSGDENVFFRNNDRDITYSPVWQGLRDHGVAINRGSAGLVLPMSRTYDPSVTNVLSSTGPHASAIVNGTYTYTTTRDTAQFGISVIIEEPILAGETISIKYYQGPAAIFPPIFEEKIRNQTYASGTTLQWYFDKPIETMRDQLYTVALEVTVEATGAVRVLQVRAEVDDVADVFRLDYIRNFVDRPVSMGDAADREEAIALALFPDSIHAQDGEMLMIDTANHISWAP